MRAVLFALFACSCSFVTVTGPGRDASSAEVPRCTRNALLPIVIDGMLAIVGLGAGIGVAVNAADTTRSDGDRVGFALGGAAIAAAGVAFVDSAIVGYRRSDACAQAWDAYGTR